MLIGRHPLDLLSQTSNPEIATVGNYGSEAYIRFYNSNNPDSGHIFGINSNGALFASNISGGDSVLRIDALEVSTIASTRNDSNITFRDVNLLGLCNVQLIGQLLDKDGNPYSLSGGSGTGGFADYSVYTIYNPESEPTRTIQTNDPIRTNRVLFSMTLLVGRFYLNGVIPYVNLDSFVPINSTNWASVNVYNGTIEQYDAGVATLIQSTPFFSTTTTPGATQYFGFNTFVDTLTELPDAQRFIIAIEGTGHRLAFDSATVSLKSIPVQTSTGLGGVDGDSVLVSRSISINPARSVFNIGDGESSNIFSLSATGNFITTASNTDVYINGTKYVYMDALNKDYDVVYNYISGTQQTVFTVALASPATAGDVVDITVWPQASTSNYYSSGKFYQATSVTSTPWLNVVGGGVRYGGDVIIDGNVIIQGDIIGGSNTRDFITGVQLDTLAMANISCNVIGTLNIIDYSITPKKLRLTEGNVGIGTTNPLRKLDITGDIRVDGVFYDASDTPIWLPSTSLQWATPLSPPIFTVPGGGAVSYSRSNALYRWIGDDIGYNVNIAATVTTVPTGTLTASACNYLLSLPYPINSAAYPADTIIGDLWLSTISSNAGTSNAFKAYARSTAGNANAVTIRALTGTTDESLAVLTIGTRMTLQGTLIYRTTSINQSLSVPAFYTPAQIAQDQDGNIGVNLPSAQPPRGGMDVYASNVTAGLVIDQVSTGDIVEFKSAGVTKVVIDAAGNLGVGTGTAQAPVYIEANSGGTAGVIVNQVGTGAIMELKDAGVSKVFVDGNGNVGIGTTQPVTTLEVAGNMNVTGIIGDNLLATAPYLTFDGTTTVRDTFLSWMQYVTSYRYRSNFASSLIKTGTWWNTSSTAQVYDSLTYSTVAASGVTNYAYYGAVLIPDGRVVFVPHGATTTIGIFTPTTNTFSTVAMSPSSATYGYAGGILLPDGRVVFVPYNATTIGIFNPATNVYSTILGAPGGAAYGGGVLLPDGRVVFVPMNVSNIGIFNSVTNSYSTIIISPAPGSDAYRGGVLLPDGRVVFVPTVATTIGIFNPTTNAYTTITGAPGSYAYNGGVLLPDGRVVFVPFTATTIGLFNPVTNTFSTILGAPGTQAYVGGAVLPDGRVVFSPHNATTIGLFNPLTNTYSTILGAPGSGAYYGTILIPDGRCIFVPTNVATVGIINATHRIRAPPLELCYHPCFNKL
jgi:hypothetical protein